MFCLISLKSLSSPPLPHAVCVLSHQPEVIVFPSSSSRCLCSASRAFGHPSLHTLALGVMPVLSTVYRGPCELSYQPTVTTLSSPRLIVDCSPVHSHALSFLGLFVYCFISLQSLSFPRLFVYCFTSLQSLPFLRLFVCCFTSLQLRPLLP